MSLTILTACSNPRGYITHNETRLMNPEVSNQQWAGRLAVGRDARSQVITDVREHNNESFSSSPDDEFLFTEIALAKSGVELFHRSSQGETIGIKYQFSGQHSEAAQSGNIAQAIAFSVEFSNENEGSYYRYNDNACIVDEPCHPSDTSTYEHWQNKTKTLDLAWIGGYRINKNLIIYGGPYIQYGKIYINSDSQDYELLSDQSARKLGLSLALEHRFNNKIGVAAEIVGSNTKWHNRSLSNTGASFKVDYQF